jgi:uncharacterized protein YfaS (alpha-2-macroglobulin family)/TolA-binding protein
MRNLIFSLLAGILALTAVEPAFARRAPATPLDLGRRALADRRYDDAARELTAAVGLGGAKADEAQFLLGNALFFARKYPEAIAAYNLVLQQHPNSRWRRKALFRKADCYLALKQYDKAAEIYEPELAYITSDARKEQVADTYMHYALQYFEPPKNPRGETPAPNFAKAKSLFEKALEIGLTTKRREEVLFKIALCDFNAGRFAEAVPSLQELVREFPKGARVEAARQHIGLCQLRLGNDREARGTLRDFLTDYPKSALRGDVSYAIAQSYHVPDPRDDRELDLGIQALRAFAAGFPQHPRVVEAEYFVGLSYFNRQRYADATRELQAFLNRRGKEVPPPPAPGTAGDEVAQARHHLGLALLRQKRWQEAIAAWEQFLREHPVHRLWNTVQRQLIDASYAIGDEAYRAKRYDEARRVWQSFQERYPLDVRNGDIMFRLGMMLHEEKQYPAAVEQWRKVASKYPDTESASRAQFMIGMTAEKQDHFEEAMAAYREVKGLWQAEAQRRVQGMRQRKLATYTERTFTTADNPALKIVTRNVRRIVFRAYRVNMADYFRKLHTIRGVEKLDLALIAPDQRWELDLPRFQEFKEMETEAPLPFREPGVYAVICEAQLTPEEAQPYRDAGREPPVLETTNVVLITDLGIITKATHRDLFVFAENLRAGQPAPNVTVLVSDGHRILATGKTGPDGVFHAKGSGFRIQSGSSSSSTSSSPAEDSSEQEEAPRSVRVLANGEGHYASTEEDLANVAQVAGIEPTAYLYTDRPVYRPGQPVRLRGIVRQVENGLYVFKQGDEYDLAVLDPAGATLHRRKVQLGEFGTFSDELTLPGETILGQYKILLTQKRDQRPTTNDQRPTTTDRGPTSPVVRRSSSVVRPAFSAEGSFVVASYRLEKVRLAVELPKSVYLRGEEIKGKIRARYYYGEPLARRRIRFGWVDEAGEERETNEQGEIEFTLPTRQFEEEATTHLWAQLEEEGVQAAVPIYIAVVGVTAQMSMLRDLHLVGERFDVTVAARDLAGKPFAGNFTLKALHREKDAAGLPTEREVQTLSVATDAKDGKGKASLTLKEAGDYLLRLTGQDAGGNPLASESETRVVGDEDEVRLRLLTDTDSFKLGETASVRVLWRGSARTTARPEDGGTRLALVTYEGEGVYGYQLATLKKGDNEIRVPLAPPLSPVFQLSVSLMDGSEFHEATRWLRVEQRLQVKIRTERPKEPGAEAASFRPGDPVRVLVETTDQNGKPVAAELSLAAVDAALLAVAAGDRARPEEWFGSRQAQEGAVLTGTSCTFHYADEARQRVVQVREAESMLNVMLAGIGAGEEIGPGHWAYDQLQRLAGAGLVEGWQDGRLNGRSTLNRADVAGALGRALERLGVTDAAAQQLYRGGARRAAPAQSDRAGRGGQGSPFGANGPQGQAGDAPADNESQVREALGRLSQEFKGELEQQQRLKAEPGKPAAERAPAAPAQPESRASAAERRGRDVLGHPLDNFIIQSPFAGSAPRPLLEPGFARVEQDGTAGLRSQFLETAYWNARVVTDASGKGAAEFTLPDSLTEWQLAALGVTRNTLAGEGEAAITASKSFMVELKAPALLQQGDRVAVTAVVHNNSDHPVKATVNLNTRFNDAAGGPQSPISNPQSLTLAARSAGEARFNVEVPNSRSATFRLQATGDGADLTDALEQTVAVRPWGIEHLVATGGTAQADRAVEVKLPPGKYLTQRLSITVGPSIQTTLLQIAASPEGYGWGQPLTDTLAQRLLCLVNAVGYLRSLGRGDTPEAHRLAAELESVVARLAATQQRDGGWTWALPATGERQAQGDERAQRAPRPGDLRVTTDAVSGLAQAKQLGFTVPAPVMTLALAFLQARFQATGEGDHAQKAVILYAQSAAGVADFAPVNRLHRLRSALDTRSLALLTLALLNMNRDAMALECARLLVERLPRDELSRYLKGSLPVEPGPYPYPGPGPSSVNLLSLEDVALVTLALAKADPKNALLADLEQLLWTRRAGNGWATPRDTALVLAALIQRARDVQIAPEKYTLVVSVNDREVRRIEVAGNATTSAIEVPAEALGSQPGAKVGFALQGRGTYTYSCVLAGFTDQGLLDDRAAEAPETPGGAPAPLRVRRTVIQAPLVWSGKPVPRGFATVANATPWENLAGEVGLGRKIQVRLSWNMPAGTGSAGGRYVLVREPVPSGCRVLEDSIKGPFERYEMGEAEITFFFYQQRGGTITYDLYGALPGTYRALPARVSVVDQPGLYAYGTTKELAVLDRDGKPKDQYRLTPDELFFLGHAHFGRVEEAIFNEQAPPEIDVKAAEGYLSELFDRDADPKGWKLADAPARETTRMLFTLALHRNDAARTVRFFEVLRERFPSVVIPFKEIVQTARAYRAIGEREREVQVYRATAESSFGNEARVAGVLEDEGEYAAAFEYLADLGQQYPDLANVESSLYALAQTISQRAEQNRQSGARTVYRDLSAQAAGILQDFVALYPENPLGDEASFAYAVNLVEQEQFEEAAQWCARSLQRYPKSQYADAFAYLGAYASFLGEKFDDALKMAQALATTDYPQSDGSMAPSRYRLFALYIAAQIHHARNQPGEAVKYYAQVAGQFPDAREAAAFFRARLLRVPEVLAVGPTEAARVKVTGRNVADVQVSVYKVDLLKFYQNRRSLVDLSQMNLAGIKPTWEGTVSLGPQEFIDKEKTLDLPLKEKGAYFLALKAGDGDSSVHASGLVVRTELGLEVQEDPGSGRVRVNVVNRTTGALQPKAEVWVVGSDNDAFRRGMTDLRGIVFVDDVRGRPAVIVARGDDYAFYRGEAILQPQLARQTVPGGGMAGNASPAAAARPPQPQAGLAFKEQARGLYAQTQRANEGKQAGYLRSQVMGFVPTPPAPGAAGAFGGGGIGGAMGGGLGGSAGGRGGLGGGVSAGAVK